MTTQMPADPSWTEVVTAIGTAVGALAIVLAAFGAWFTYKQLRETRRDRHIQVITEFAGRWDDERLLEARELIQDYSATELAELARAWLAPPREKATEHFPKLQRIPNFFEDLAILVDCGNLELIWVAKSFHGLALREWAYWQPAIEVMREYEPETYVEFETLVRKLETFNSQKRQSRLKRRERF